MLVDDVPVVSDYAIKTSDFNQYFDQIDGILKIIEIEIANFEKLGGGFLEKVLMNQFFPELGLNDNSIFARQFKNFSTMKI